jgi:hypothetical protein
VTVVIVRAADQSGLAVGGQCHAVAGPVLDSAEGTLVSLARGGELRALWAQVAPVRVNTHAAPAGPF